MRWLVTFLLLVSCAESTLRNLDDPADSPASCTALNEIVCDMCDPEGLLEECAPASIDGFCEGLEWRCIPTPTVGQDLDCRRAFARALSEAGCMGGEELLVPECDVLDSCL